MKKTGYRKNEVVPAVTNFFIAIIKHHNQENLSKGLFGAKSSRGTST